MRLAGLLAFLPQETIPLLVLCGGFLIMFGCRKLATTLFILCGVMIVAPIVLDPILKELPDWVLYLLVAYLVLDLIAMFIVLIAGERAWDEAKGHLIAQVITFIFLAPFRLLRLILFGPRRR